MKPEEFIIIFCLSSCFACDNMKEEITPDIKDKNLPDIAVNGMITDQLKIHTVKINKVPVFTSKVAPEPVSGALVSISCDDSVFVLSESNTGTYQTSPYVKGEVGKTYTLKINYNGKEYSASSKINPPLKIDTLYTLPASEKGKYYIFFSSYEPVLAGSNDIFKVYKNGIIDDTIKNWAIVNDFLDEELTLHNIPIFEYNASESDSLILESYSVDKVYIDFVLAADQTTLEPDPYFSSPPANLKTNLSKGAVGYFLASAVSSNHCIVK